MCVVMAHRNETERGKAAFEGSLGNITLHPILYYMKARQELNKVGGKFGNVLTKNVIPDILQLSDCPNL